MEFEGRVIEKPIDKVDSKRMLTELSGKSHFVHTAVAIFTKGVSEPVSTFVSSAKVTFANLTEAEIDGYVATGDGLDKSGSYGIQTIGCSIVEKIEGDFFTAMGLPSRMLSVELANLINTGVLSA